MTDIISYFGEIAEEIGWKISRREDGYTVESTFGCACIAPYRFDALDNGQPVTAGAFADIVCGEYKDFDVSKETYSRLNSDGYYKADCSYSIESVYSDVKRVHSKLDDLRLALADRYEQIEKDIVFYNEPHTTEEKCSYVLESVLGDDRLSDGEIVDMMYSLVRDVAKYAISHNNSKTNHLARELLGGVFLEEELKCFDEPPLDDENGQLQAADDSLSCSINTVTEVCPHCENEIEMVWNVNDRGYKAFCPVCGQRLMLCDECAHCGPNKEKHENKEER